MQWFSGTPITRLNAHPVYENAGEVPVGKRGDAGRTPTNYTVDVHTDYGLPIRQGLDLRASIDVFNILDNQEVARVNEFNEQAPGLADPDFGKAISYQAPRSIRFGLRLAF